MHPTPAAVLMPNAEIRLDGLSVVGQSDPPLSILSPYRVVRMHALQEELRTQGANLFGGASQDGLALGVNVRKTAFWEVYHIGENWQ